MNSKALQLQSSLSLELPKIQPNFNILIPLTFAKYMKSNLILFKKRSKKRKSSKHTKNATHQRPLNKRCLLNKSTSLQTNKIQHRDYTNAAIVPSCALVAPRQGAAMRPLAKAPIFPTS